MIGKEGQEILTREATACRCTGGLTPSCRALPPTNSRSSGSAFRRDFLPSTTDHTVEYRKIFDGPARVAPAAEDADAGMEDAKTGVEKLWATD